MKNVFLLILILAFPLNDEPQEETILIVGDSLAFGLSKPMGEIAKRNDVRFYSDGRGGTTLKQWVEFGWVKKDCQKYEPNTILVSLGINDYASPSSREKISERSKHLVNLVGDAEVIWLIPAAKRKSSEYIYEAVKDSGAMIFDARQLDIEHPKGDIHPTGKGYKAWAKAIWEFIRPPQRH